MNTCTSCPKRTFLTSCSVSRPAVPSPTATASIRYSSTKEASRCIASASRFCGGCGKMVSLCSRLPCPSRHTTLQPVRNPGSIANTRFCPSGAASNNCRRFSANTFIDSSSARALASVNVSPSIDGFNNRLYPSRTAASTKGRTGEGFRLIKIRSSCSTAADSSGNTDSLINPSRSARTIASRRWAATRRNGSDQSK